VPRVPERRRRHPLPSAGVALVAWQGCEGLSKAMASIDPLVDAIRTSVDAVVSLRRLTLRRIERFLAAAANYGTAAEIPLFNAPGQLFQTPQNAAT